MSSFISAVLGIVCFSELWLALFALGMKTKKEPQARLLYIFGVVKAIYFIIIILREAL